LVGNDHPPITFLWGQMTWYLCVVKEIELHVICHYWMVDFLACFLY